MTVADLIALSTGCIGFAVGWISARIVEASQDTQVFLTAVKVLEQIEEKTYV